MGAIGEKISKETIREKVISTIDMTREPQEQEPVSYTHLFGQAGNNSKHVV